MSPSDPLLQESSPFSLTVARAGGAPSTAIASAGGPFDGVVRVSDGSVYGSGTLLSTGRHILTAAHVVDESSAEELRVYFTLVSGITTVQVSRVIIHPGWMGSADTIDHDLAILELSGPAPSSAQTYDLYTNTDEIGQAFTLVGYGESQDRTWDTSSPTRRYGENLFESDAARFTQQFGWKVTGNRQLVFDYDNGSLSNDAFGRNFGLVDLGLGSRESIFTHGDSGGPSFLNKDGKLLVAGINSYTVRAPSSDIDSASNGSFGEFAGVMRVSAYRPWIDSVTGVDRVIMGETGTHPSRTSVSNRVAEGYGTWFLVEIGSAQSIDVSVHYATRDGTARAGEDYLAAHGDIVFAPGQTWCKVFIETLDDSRAEGDETFSLVLSNPKNGHFADGQVELVAVRTILDWMT